MSCSGKMIRFLQSLDIKNVEDFDMNFKVAKLDEKNHEVLLMTILVEKPWNYYALEEFLRGLGTIEYPYQLTYEYVSLKDNDVYELFKDWVFAKYGILLDPKGHDDVKAWRGDWRAVVLDHKLSLFCYDKANYSSINEVVDEFNLLLQAIQYPYSAEAILEASEEEEERQKANLEAEENYLAAKRLAKYNLKGNYMTLQTLAEIESLQPQNVSVTGELFSCDTKTMNRGQLRFTFGLGDGRGAINGRAFENKDVLSREALQGFADGDRVNIRGKLELDKFSGEQILVADYIDKLPPLPLRDDPEIEKRVELHLHTKMSVMDGLSEMDRYCKIAKNMGWKAIAVTDHGNIQAFPDAQLFCNKNGLKPIFGCEFYMFEPNQKYVFNPSNRLLSKSRFCVLDLETTGLSSVWDRITQFSGTIIENGMEVDSFTTFVNPEIPIPLKIQEKTNIHESDVKDAPTIDKIMPKIISFIGDAILVTHNAAFDFGFLNANLKRLGLEILHNPVVDTMALSHYLFPERKFHNLQALCSNLGLDVYEAEKAHRADNDVAFLVAAWNAILARLDPWNKLTHAELMNLRFNADSFPEYQGESLDKKIRETLSSFYKNIRPTHIVALVKDEQGLKDMYKLVSLSNTTYLADVPKIPKEELAKYREHLLLGSACWNGEVFDKAMNLSLDELKEVVSFYDYIEIQPIENYSYLVYMDELDERRLHQVLELIIQAADEAGVPIVATGDVHYADPEDKIARDVFIDTKAIGNSRHPLNPNRRDHMPAFPNPDQHLRSTKEMLDSFRKWLPEERCKEIVVTNSNWVADQIQKVVPVKPDIFPPNANLPGSAELLRKLCYENLHKTYGENPDPKIVERLEKELNGIIGNGYSVTYYIAHRIIKKATEDGYFVGSRGSVGSSFAATMADITEVNPLPPHYLCPHCHHFEWNEDPKIRSGFDLDPKKCPECGTEMLRNGQGIPFETFLGFHAEKVPDIDLNFPPDYQARAHDFTRELLGPQNCFRAGTIQTVADKNAFGYVRGYYERRGINPDSISTAKIAMIADKCKGVKRTTGQHPGGIVVIPKDMDVFDFTPYQYPAEDINSDWLTTHYDFGSMHDEVLKLDLLGHVDPLALRKLSLVTGIPFNEVPVDDRKVLSLFNSPKALGMKTNPLKFVTGAVALPEFGTSFVQGLLAQAKPKTFNDLLIISGLSHGTDVWSYNAEDLIKNKTTDIGGVIGCRDDIMNYLIGKGIDSSFAFKFMETVRKNKGHANLSKIEAMIPELAAQGIPDWYLESCKKIQYLFPRAHATAYVINAVRNAWFKLYKPLHFYAVYFSVRCEKFDIKTMCEGLPAVLALINEYNTRNSGRTNPLSEKEKEILKTLTAAAEMLDRGYHFHKIDLYKSEATDFVVDEENKALYPPFIVIDNLGNEAAESVVRARKDGPFISKEDLHDRTGLSEANINDLSALGVLDGMGESNQMSIFDF